MDLFYCNWEGKYLYERNFIIVNTLLSIVTLWYILILPYSYSTYFNYCLQFVQCYLTAVNSFFIDSATVGNHSTITRCTYTEYCGVGQYTKTSWRRCKYFTCNKTVINSKTIYFKFSYSQFHHILKIITDSSVVNYNIYEQIIFS